MSAAPSSLIAANQAHVHQMMAWFPTQASCEIWGGYAFRFPFTRESFEADTKWRELTSYVLASDDGTVSAFGQFYPRVKRCHLGRLAVSPALRGQGLGTRLIRLLAKAGTDQLRTNECSLFVLPENTAARQLYERLGFRPTPYPDSGQNTTRMHYLVATLDAILAAAPPPT